MPRKTPVRIARAGLAAVAAWLGVSVCLAQVGATESLAGAAAPGAAIASLRKFNDADFSLAYEVFLAAGQQKRAFEIAQQAVTTAPQDVKWRKRLATVAQWTDRPDVAALQWAALLRLGDHSDLVIDNVLRLSAFADDAAVVLDAWSVKAGRTPMSPAQWQDLANLYEQASDPAKGSLYFEQQFQRVHDPKLLEFASAMADRAGARERALTLLQRRVQLQPFSQGAVVQLVNWLVSADRTPQALEVMLAVAHNVAGDQVDYWRLLGQLAWELADDVNAEMAYRKCVALPQASPEDWARLLTLVQSKQPREAAELALRAYQRFGRIDHYLLALELYLANGTEAEQKRILEQPSGAQLVQLSQSGRFLLPRAAYYIRTKQPDLAWGDLRAARRLDPEDPDALLASLWFLVDERRKEELGPLLREQAQLASTVPALWSAYAAGYQLLGRPYETLAWIRKAVQSDPDGALPLLSYADALDAVGKGAASARVRRHAWVILTKKYPQPALNAAALDTPERLARARMLLDDKLADPAREVARQMAQRLRANALGANETEISTSLLARALNREQYAGAQNWIRLHFMQQGKNTAPLWARAQLALQTRDRTEMSALLAEHVNELPVANAYDMAYELERPRVALKIAREAIDKGQEVQAMAERLRLHQPLHANYVQTGYSLETIGSQADENGQTGTLSIQETQFEARISPFENFQLVVNWTRRAFGSDNPDFASPFSASDRLTGLEAIWLGQRRSSTLALFERSAQQSQIGLRAGHTRQIDPRTDVSFALEYQVPTALSLPLRLGGYENDVQASVGYALGRRESVRLGARASEYFSPLGEFWGRSSLLDVEAAYRLRLDYPDWRLRALLSQQETQASDGLSAYYIPQGATTLSLCTDMGVNLAGQSVRDNYSRTWRPYFELCASHNSLDSDGYDAAIGMVGSVVGNDHLRIELRNSESSQPASPAIQKVSLRYRHYF